MISNELLSAVLKEKRVILDYEISINKNEIHYGHIDIEEDGFINIYELAHRCKEWAYKQGYTIDVYNKTDGLFIEVSKSILGTYLYKSLLFDLEDEKNELFNACQWILDKDSK